MSSFGKMNISPVPAPPGSPTERIQRALAILTKRGVTNDHCPRCNTFDWNVDLLEIPATSAISTESSGMTPFGSGPGYSNYVPSYRSTAQTGSVLQVMSIVCKNCGYTMFHNLRVLGV